MGNTASACQTPGAAGPTGPQPEPEQQQLQEGASCCREEKLPSRKKNSLRDCAKGSCQENLGVNP